MMKMRQWSMHSNRNHCLSGTSSTPLLRQLSTVVGGCRGASVSAHFLAQLEPWEPKGGAPKGGAPKCGAPKGGGPNGGPPKISRFFSLSLGVLSWIGQFLLQTSCHRAYEQHVIYFSIITRHRNMMPKNDEGGSHSSLMVCFVARLGDESKPT